MATNSADKPKRNLGRGGIIWIAVIIAVILAAGFVVVNFVQPRLTGTIASVTFSQSKAVPDYDGADYTVTDRERLAELERLIKVYGVVPAVPFISADNGCTGGTSTSIEITYDSGIVVANNFYDCDESGFIPAATDLLESWKD